MGRLNDLIEQKRVLNFKQLSKEKAFLDRALYGLAERGWKKV